MSKFYFFLDLRKTGIELTNMITLHSHDSRTQFYRTENNIFRLPETLQESNTEPMKLLMIGFTSCLISELLIYKNYSENERLSCCAVNVLSSLHSSGYF
jgi:hypothetical protein